jgi:hypothetical protein
MTLTLHFGVVDIPYSTNIKTAPRRVGVRSVKGGKARAFSAAPSGGETTGDVAQILEDKYHIMEIFVEEIGADRIEKAVEHSIAGALETMISSHGRNTPDSFLTTEAEGEIEDAFRLFLSQGEMDGIQPGVPTKAALAGVSHRFAHPYAKRPARPSFIDTGTYQASFKVWSDG